MKRSLIRFIPMALLLSGCGGNLGMIGYNFLGMPTKIHVKEQEYQQNLTRALTAIDASVRPALKAEAEQEKEWKLRTAVIGFGVKVQGGIGELKASAKPQIHVAFSNGSKPPVP